MKYNIGDIVTFKYINYPNEVMKKETFKSQLSEIIDK